MSLFLLALRALYAKTNPGKYFWTWKKVQNIGSPQTLLILVFLVDDYNPILPPQQLQSCELQIRILNVLPSINNSKILGL